MTHPPLESWQKSNALAGPAIQIHLPWVHPHPPCLQPVKRPQVGNHRWRYAEDMHPFPDKRLKSQNIPQASYSLSLNLQKLKIHQMGDVFMFTGKPVLRPQNCFIKMSLVSWIVCLIPPQETRCFVTQRYTGLGLQDFHRKSGIRKPIVRQQLVEMGIPSSSSHKI